jgi:4-hydroxyphenylacetate 3-monooxygenase
LTFQLFAQSPPFAHLAAIYRNFDWTNALSVTQHCAGLSDRIWADQQPPNKPFAT